MAKIGRNNPCPCGSGKKYKKCCLLTRSDSSAVQAAPPPTTSVREEIGKLQKAAVNQETNLKTVGVFIFFSTPAGDAWLLEMTDMDAVIVARAGRKIEVEIEESPETIEISWSHQFEIKNKKFTTTSYADKTIEIHDNSYPSATINSAIRKIQKNFSNDLLESIHLDN